MTRRDPTGERTSRGGPFTRLWTAATVSGIGDGVTLTAAPLLAASITSDPRLIAGVTVALTLPFVVFGLPAGVLVDRVDRRRSMAVIDTLRGMSMAVLAVTVWWGRPHLVVLFACLFVVGVGETFYRNASQAFVPALVPVSGLMTANARLEASQTVGTQFLGPLLGSALFAVAPVLPFGLDGVSFLVSALLLATMRPARGAAPAPAADPERRSFLADMTTGAVWLARHRLLRVLALTAGAINLVVAGSTAVLVVYAGQVLGLHEIGFGLLLACQAAGAVLAAPVGPAVVRLLGRERALVVVALSQAVGCAVLWLFGSRISAGAALALIGCASVTWNVVVVALRQTLVPDRLQGRVNSVYRLVAWGAMPVGAAAAGMIAARYGVAAFYLAGAVLMVVIAARLAMGARRQWITVALGTGEEADVDHR